MEDCRNPSLRLRAAAAVIYDAGRMHGWPGYVAANYEALEKSDPIGFEEFNEIVADALEAADAVE